MMMPFTLLFFDAPRAQIRDDFVRDSLRVWCDADARIDAYDYRFFFSITPDYFVA
jgi:hypothetical protein